VIYNVRIFLNRADEVLMNPSRPDATGEGIRRVDGEAFADHVTTLGRRKAIAGIEKALVGMRVGGWRRVRVGAHLAYGSRGVPGRIPPGAVLNIKLSEGDRGTVEWRAVRRAVDRIIGSAIGCSDLPHEVPLATAASCRA
jgi:hypothetical protein